MSAWPGVGGGDSVDPDRDEVVGLRAAILELATEISIGLADPD
jgi:hypothetical protein